MENININLNVTNNGVEVGEVEYEGNIESPKKKKRDISFERFFKERVSHINLVGNANPLTLYQEKLLKMFELDDFPLIGVELPRQVGATTLFFYYHWYMNNIVTSNGFKSLYIDNKRERFEDKLSCFSENLRENLEYFNAVDTYNSLDFRSSKYDLVFFDNLAYYENQIHFNLEKTLNKLFNFLNTRNSKTKIVCVNGSDDTKFSKRMKYNFPLKLDLI